MDFNRLAACRVLREFRDWIVLGNESAGESALIGGEPGLGVLGWKATTRPSASGHHRQCRNLLLKDKARRVLLRSLSLLRVETVETPITFFALAKGDTDDAGNEAFRYLKRYVFLTPVTGRSPGHLLHLAHRRRTVKCQSFGNSIWRSGLDSTSSTTMPPGTRAHRSFQA